MELFMKKKDLSALLTLLAVVFFGCGAALLFSKSRREPISRSAFLLNTFVNITLYDSQDEAILDHCVDMCQEYENRFSKTIEGSELYKLNHRSTDETTFTVSDDIEYIVNDLECQPDIIAINGEGIDILLSRVA